RNLGGVSQVTATRRRNEAVDVLLSHPVAEGRRAPRLDNEGRRAARDHERLWERRIREARPGLRGEKNGIGGLLRAVIQADGLHTRGDAVAEGHIRSEDRSTGWIDRTENHFVRISAGGDTSNRAEPDGPAEQM